MSSGSMHAVSFYAAVMLIPELLQFLAHHVIFPDLLVDDEECWVEGKHHGENHRDDIVLHRLSPGDNGEGPFTRRQKERGHRGSLPFPVVRGLQARAGTVSAQVSTVVRMASAS